MINAEHPEYYDNSPVSAAPKVDSATPVSQSVQTAENASQPKEKSTFKKIMEMIAKKFGTVI